MTDIHPRENSNSPAQIVAIKTVVIVADHAYINGGQAKVAVESALLLAKSGLRVLFFCGHAEIDSRLERAGVEVTSLRRFDLLDDPRVLRAAVSHLWSASVKRELTRVLRDCVPGSCVVHVHGWAKNLTPSIAAALRGGGRPVVYTQHEFFLACPNGGFYNYRRKHICGLAPLGTKCLTTNCDSRSYLHKIWRVVRQVILRYISRWPGELKHIIYISETQKAAVRKYLPPAAQLHYVPNPLESYGGTRVEAEKNDKFVFVGRLSPEKGGLLFAKAAVQAGVKAVFIGAGEEAEQIRRTGPDIEVLGWQDASEVVRLLRRARVLVFPSLWYECQPLVPMEALMLGVPVIAGKWTAVKDQMHPRGGVLLETSDIDEWAEVLRKLADDSPRVKSMSTHSFEHAKTSSFGRESHLKRLLEVYAEAMAV